MILLEGSFELPEKAMHPTPVVLPGKSHGGRSLVGCSPWGREKSDTTERLHFHFSLSCIGGGNGNPLQCSCLENPRDGGAWWAAVYGVAQSRTRLTRYSSSSSSSIELHYRDNNWDLYPRSLIAQPLWYFVTNHHSQFIQTFYHSPTRPPECLFFQESSTSHPWKKRHEPLWSELLF